MARGNWMRLDGRNEGGQVVCLLLLLVLIAVACGCALATFATAADAPKPVGILQSNSSWRGTAHSVVQLPNFTMVLPAGTVGDDFVFLGHGSCINQQGERFFGPVLDYASTPRADGTSPECTKLCQMVPSCSGYEVRGNATMEKCFIFADGIFHPSAARGGVDVKCFWKHPIAKDTQTAYSDLLLPVPKIIWSFWKTLPGSPKVLQLFVDACLASWKALNPEYEIRVLDDETVHEFLTAEDLPQTFDFLTIQHKSDAIRLALLLKYGGVWLDTTTLMTHSLESLLGTDLAVRTFFSLPPIWEDQTLRANDTRVSWKDHAYNWFLESPPGDLFMQRVKECAWQFLNGVSRHDLRLTGMFTPQQLEIMNRLGIRTYLSSDACIFRTIFEDRALWTWFHSDRVRIHDPTGKLGFGWMANMTHLGVRILNRVDHELADEFINDKGLFMKYTSDMRKAMVLIMEPEVIWCRQNTFRLVMDAIGVDSASRCHSVSEVTAPNA